MKKIKKIAAGLMAVAAMATSMASLSASASTLGNDTGVYCSWQWGIDNLSNEVEMLKKNVENNGMMVATTTDAYVATNTDAIPAGVAVPNAAAERNNANVIGISRTAIEEMIKHE